MYSGAQHSAPTSFLALGVDVEGFGCRAGEFWEFSRLLLLFVWIHDI